MNSTIERDYKPDNPTAVTVSEVLAEIVLKRPLLQVLWDHMMTQLECCGVQGYTDFTSQVSFPESLSTRFNWWTPWQSLPQTP